MADNSGKTTGTQSPAGSGSSGEPSGTDAGTSKPKNSVFAAQTGPAPTVVPPSSRVSSVTGSTSSSVTGTNENIWLKAASTGITGSGNQGLRDLAVVFGTNTTSSAALGGIGAFRRSVFDADDDFRARYKKIDDEMSRLKNSFEQQAIALNQEQASARGKEARIRALEATLRELEAKENLGVLLNNVNSDAQRRLLADEQFQKLFLQQSDCSAFVMSVDIRRSTELMLKARSPEMFARFITTLCADLIDIIKRNFGVFDKFTGDGVLAFFPAFYSGPSAAFLALLTADQCHAAFKKHYHAFRKSFKTVLADVGLGIGIDFGSVRLVQMGPGLTVVGEPVVYACRFSSAPAGFTYLNQPAYEQLADQFGQLCFIEEAELDIKHEGEIVAYSAKLNGRPYEPAQPDWLKPQAPGSGGS